MKATITFLVLIFFFTVLHPNRDKQIVFSGKTKLGYCIFTKSEKKDVLEMSITDSAFPETMIKPDKPDSSCCVTKKKGTIIQSADNYFVWIVL